MFNMLKRTLVVKHDMIRFYTFTSDINSDFVNLQSYLEATNTLPSELEIPIPQYFQVEQDLKRKNEIRNLFEEMKDFDVYTDSHSLYKRKNVYEFNPLQALLNIINHERGRQAIERGNLEKERLMQLLKKHELD